ncbi:unnamed protein product [Prorocentrum cordatum]|uniref:Uncharacterized protein n=1 Tax=Prorocentrum cordatum TaxID=2364126 RepID=A0ABN9VWW9_9DINO|nr:unnamed protein product [Polarella glacialis]
MSASRPAARSTSTRSEKEEKGGVYIYDYPGRGEDNSENSDNSDNIATTLAMERTPRWLRAGRPASHPVLRTQRSQPQKPRTGACASARTRLPPKRKAPWRASAAKQRSTLTIFVRYYARAANEQPDPRSFIPPCHPPPSLPFA